MQGWRPDQEDVRGVVQACAEPIPHPEEDVRKSPWLSAWMLDHLKTVSLLALPLRTASNRQGLAFILFDREHQFTHEEITSGRRLLGKYRWRLQRHIFSKKPASEPVLSNSLSNRQRVDRFE